MRNTIAAILVILFGSSLLWFGTDGFRAYTAEGARRLAIQEHPRDLPAAVFQDSQGNTFQLQDYRGKLVLVTFMFTGCADACPILETNFKQVYQLIAKQYLGKDVVLLSISFDPKRDVPKVLNEYAHMIGADGVNWRVARFVHSEEQKAMLKRFEVVVIPNDTGGYEHNTGIYLIDRKGRLAKIYDYNAPRQVAEELQPLLKLS
jgi:protein SCO1